MKYHLTGGLQGPHFMHVVQKNVQSTAFINLEVSLKEHNIHRGHFKVRCVRWVIRHNSRLTNPVSIQNHHAKRNNSSDVSHRMSKSRPTALEEGSAWAKGVCPTAEGGRHGCASRRLERSETHYSKLIAALHLFFHLKGLLRDGRLWSRSMYSRLS